MFPIKDHEAIIDAGTFHQVQEKLKPPTKPKKIICDELPLRGVLRCHCGKLLTGAPSKGRNGRIYYFYKCHGEGQHHNNVSALKSHAQLEEELNLMSFCLNR